MIRRVAALAIMLALVGSVVLPSPAAAQTLPRSMAATGDSITRAFNLCFFPFTDCPAQSWSTGTNSTVNSHARRLKITSSAYNDAVSGAKMSDLPSQVNTVFGRNVDYVTVLMGGNDVCTDTEGGMTAPSSYESAFRQAMDKLNTDSSPPLVYVLSVPNVKMLWEILKDNSSARSRWASYNTCQSLLADPLSTAQADVDRRERVKQRNMELNQRLRSACAAYAFCRFDGERTFGTAFVPSDVSTRDYFHPSTDGQKKLAEVSWLHGPYVTSAVNGAPTAAFTASCASLTCTFSDASTDADGVTGWSWNFDAAGTAGRTSVDRHPTYTFAAAGTYTVKLFAIDRYGATASTTASVTVSSEGSGGGGETNDPPKASFSFACSNLSCTFTDMSTDDDPSLAGWSWAFGDEGTSTVQHPTHTYGAGGSYTVMLTVTDNDGATNTTTQSVSVSAPAAGITLTVTAYKVKGVQHADLEWSGATGTNVDIHRDDAVITTTANDSTYTDNIGVKGGGSYRYKVCETGTDTCSPEVTVSY